MVALAELPSRGTWSAREFLEAGRTRNAVPGLRAPEWTADNRNRLLGQPAQGPPVEDAMLSALERPI